MRPSIMSALLKAGETPNKKVKTMSVEDTDDGVKTVKTKAKVSEVGDEYYPEKGKAKRIETLVGADFVSKIKTKQSVDASRGVAKTKVLTKDGKTGRKTRTTYMDKF